jgi:hypothetical protein
MAWHAVITAEATARRSKMDPGLPFNTAAGGAQNGALNGEAAGAQNEEAGRAPNEKAAGARNKFASGVAEGKAGEASSADTGGGLHADAAGGAGAPAACVPVVGLVASGVPNPKAFFIAVTSSLSQFWASLYVLFFNM